MSKNYKVKKGNYPVFLPQNRKDETAPTAGETLKTSYILESLHQFRAEKWTFEKPQLFGNCSVFTA